MLTSSPSVPQNGTFLGKRAFKEVISLNEVIRVGPHPIQLALSPGKKIGHTKCTRGRQRGDTEKTCLCDCKDAFTDQGLPADTGSYSCQGHHAPFRESMACWHLAFRLPASRTARLDIPVVLGHSVILFFHGISRKLVRVQNCAWSWRNRKIPNSGNELGNNYHILIKCKSNVKAF